MDKKVFFLFQVAWVLWPQSLSQNTQLIFHYDSKQTLQLQSQQKSTNNMKVFLMNS